MSNREPAPPIDTQRSVASLLERLCGEHDISPVPKLEWSRRMRHTLGRAYMRQDLIRLSAWLDHRQAHDTLRHELAHIAVGSRRRLKPHGPQWRDWAERLGIEPRAVSRNGPANAPPRRDNRMAWGLECKKCGIRLVRQRVLGGLYHKDCGPRKGALVKVLRQSREQVLAWAASAASGQPA